MPREENLAAQQTLAEDVINGGRLDAVEEVFAANVVDHDPAPNQAPGPAGFREFFAALRTAFPDVRIQADKAVADDDYVSVAYRLTGTQKGEFLGIPPTGKTIEARGVQIARFHDGKIVERWGSSDELGILKQLGARVSP